MSGYELGGFQLANLLLAFVIMSVFVFILYWIWTCPCREDKSLMPKGSNQGNYKRLLPSEQVATLYAMEVEPGTVVLQSEDGEFFRILREYDTVDRTGNGSVSPEMPSCSPENQYVPSYTRAHYQTRPSAPYSDISSPLGDSTTWQPVHAINGIGAY